MAAQIYMAQGCERNTWTQAWRLKCSSTLSASWPRNLAGTGAGGCQAVGAPAGASAGGWTAGGGSTSCQCSAAGGNRSCRAIGESVTVIITWIIIEITHETRTHHCCSNYRKLMHLCITRGCYRQHSAANCTHRVLQQHENAQPWRHSACAIRNDTADGSKCNCMQAQCMG